MKTKTVVTFFFTFCIAVVTYAQKVVIVNSPEGHSYAAISTVGMPKGYETRNPAKMYYKAPLYQFMPNATSPVVPITDSEGNQIYVDRIVRHPVGGAVSYYRNSSGNWVTINYNPNSNISELFAVSPIDVYNNGAMASGNGNSITMNWAQANGFIITGNTNEIAYEASATAMGCSQYRGKLGTDQIGSWRMPTQREIIMIHIFNVPLGATNKNGTGFSTLYGGSGYWSCTESGTNAHITTIDNNNSITSPAKTSACRIRCVRDFVP